MERSSILRFLNSITMTDGICNISFMSCCSATNKAAEGSSAEDPHLKHDGTSPRMPVHSELLW